MMVRLIGFPTRETNSSHASSSEDPAQRQTTSFRDRDEYRVGLGVFDILLGYGRVVGAVGKGHSTGDGERDVESGYQSASSVIAVHPTSAIFSKKEVLSRQESNAPRVFQYLRLMDSEINEVTRRVELAITSCCLCACDASCRDYREP
jgi:hypothetical protein